MRVLLIEDDQRLTRLMTRVLSQEHIGVDVAHDGDTGLEFALTGAYQVVIVDWMLPKQDGIAICRAVRAAHLSLAILILTARVQVEDRVLGLDSGADDYLVKPFAFTELLARIRALSRRLNHNHSEPFKLRGADIVLNVRTHTVERAGFSLHLTETEWRLLECFMRHAGSVLTRQQIFEQVWGVNSDARLNMVDIYVSYLRHKLKTSQQVNDPIETIRGIGYRFDAN